MGSKHHMLTTAAAPQPKNTRGQLQHAVCAPRTKTDPKRTQGPAAIALPSISSTQSALRLAPLAHARPLRSRDPHKAAAPRPWPRHDPAAALFAAYTESCGTAPATASQAHRRAVCGGRRVLPRFRVRLAARRHARILHRRAVRPAVRVLQVATGDVRHGSTHAAHHPSAVAAAGVAAAPVPERRLALRPPLLERAVRRRWLFRGVRLDLRHCHRRDAVGRRLSSCGLQCTPKLSDQP